MNSPLKFGEKKVYWKKYIQSTKLVSIEGEKEKKVWKKMHKYASQESI